jgi:hypothetical protein
VSLGHHPPSTRRAHLSWSEQEIAELSARLRDVPPAER